MKPDKLLTAQRHLSKLYPLLLQNDISSLKEISDSEKVKYYVRASARFYIALLRAMRRFYIVTNFRFIYNNSEMLDLLEQSIDDVCAFSVLVDKFREFDEISATSIIVSFYETIEKCFDVDILPVKFFDLEKWNAQFVYLSDFAYSVLKDRKFLQSPFAL